MEIEAQLWIVNTLRPTAFHWSGRCSVFLMLRLHSGRLVTQTVTPGDFSGLMAVNWRDSGTRSTAPLLI